MCVKAEIMLTRRIVYLIAAGEQPRSIIAFTFTERAAQEMKERIYRRVEQILGSDPCRQLGDMFAGTIHSFAVRLLQDHFGYGNYDVLDENQEMAFLLRHGWSLGLRPDAKLGKTGSYSGNCSIFLRSVNAVYDELIDQAKLRKKNPDFAGELEKYERILDDNRLITFGRMIKLAVEKLASCEHALEVYRHLIVDEYQDINRAQEKLIQLVARYTTCYVVGDPRQCIYEWRGSDPGCFDRFKGHFDAETVEIVANRRSQKHIVKAANRVAKEFEELALRTPMTSVHKDDGTVELMVHETDKDEAAWLADQIKTLTHKGICCYDDVVILLRSVSTSGPTIIDELKKREIPYLVGGRVGLFRRDEVQAVGRIFVWCGDMWWQEDPFSWASRMQGKTLLASVIELWPNGVSKSKLHSFKRRILGREFDNFTQAYQELLIILGTLQWPLGDPQVDVMMANLGRFNTLLTDFESSLRRQGAKPNWQRDLRNLTWFMNAYASEAYEEQQSEDLRGQPAVKVMTVHQAKGLEWPIVFLPALTARRFPSSKTGQHLHWYLPESLFDVVRYEGSINSERKLFYVAVTRARDALCLSYFRRKRKTQSPSLFISSLKLEEKGAPSRVVVDQIEQGQVDEEEIISYSSSEIIEYLRCPHFYRLRNIWGYQPGIAELIGFGKSLHHVLRVLSERAKVGENPLEELDAVLESDFHLPFATKATIKAVRKKAQRLLKKYIEAHMADVQAAEEIEARLEFQLTKIATVTGRVDVIIAQDGGRELRDYKTADDQRSFDETSLQLRLYALGLTEIGQPISKASIGNLAETSVRTVSVSDRELEQARQTATSAIDSLLAQEFEGEPCSSCETCDYERVCHYVSGPS